MPCTITQLAKLPPHFGDSVWVIGNPLGVFYYTVTNGIVSHPHRKYKGEYFLQVDAGIIFGNSGGPVFDKYGRLIGIVDAVFFVKGPTHLGIAVPISTIRSFLKGTGRLTQLFK
jgi:serine protease Do